MRLRKPLSILLSLSMIAGMSAFASNAAVTSDESVSAGNYYNVPIRPIYEHFAQVNH